MYVKIALVLLLSGCVQAEAPVALISAPVIESKPVAVIESKTAPIPIQRSNDPAQKYRATLTREARAVYGINAPIPLFAGQIKQESGWRPDVTAPDLGRGLAQFMDATASSVSTKHKELGPVDPYNPVWAIRAMVRYDLDIYGLVKGDTECDHWGASLKGYNAGPGFVRQAQSKSDQPGVWFGVTEFVKTKQTSQNFEYSRTYPRKIIFKHQPIYSDWGAITCEGRK